MIELSWAQEGGEIVPKCSFRWAYLRSIITPIWLNWYTWSSRAWSLGAFVPKRCLLFGHSVMFDSCDPMNCSMPGFPVLHYVPEFAQIHVHWVGDAIQPTHPLLSPSPSSPSHWNDITYIQIPALWPNIHVPLKHPLNISVAETTSCQLLLSECLCPSPTQWAWVCKLVMDREAWQAAVHGVTKSWRRLSDWTELNIYISCGFFLTKQLMLDI